MKKLFTTMLLGAAMGLGAASAWAETVVNTGREDTLRE